MWWKCCASSLKRHVVSNLEMLCEFTKTSCGILTLKYCMNFTKRCVVSWPWNVAWTSLNAVWYPDLEMLHELHYEAMWYRDLEGVWLLVRLVMNSRCLNWVVIYFLRMLEPYDVHTTNKCYIPSNMTVTSFIVDIK